MTTQRSWQHTGSRQAVLAVLLAVLLPVMLIIAGFAINLCYLELVRTELQIASDSSSRAAARVMLDTGDQNQAIAAAQQMASMNQVAGTTLPIEAGDLVFGMATRSGANARYEFSPASSPVNSLQLNADSLVSAMGGRLPMPMRFGFSNITIVPSRQSIVTQAEMDVVLVVDRSGSMAYAADEVADLAYAPRNAPSGWTFGSPVPPRSRWLDARNAVSTFLTALAASPQSEGVALVTYNHSPTPELALSTSYGPINGRLDDYDMAFNAGGTNIGGGISTGMSTLASTGARPWAVRVIILLTDGINNWGPDPRTEASSAASQGVMIYTISFADEADQALMQDIANIGYGRHYHAQNSADLTNAFRDIARHLPMLLTK